MIKEDLDFRQTKLDAIDAARVAYEINESGNLVEAVRACEECITMQDTGALKKKKWFEEQPVLISFSDPVNTRRKSVLCQKSNDSSKVLQIPLFVTLTKLESCINIV